MQNKIFKVAQDYVFGVTFFIILLLWQATTTILDIPIYILPSPTDLFLALIDNYALLFTSGLITLVETLLGLICGIIFAILIAIIYNESNLIKRATFPLIAIFQTIPSVAIAPLFLIWFGVGIFPKVLLIMLTASFPIIISLTNSFTYVDQDKKNYLLSLKASKKQMYQYLYYPESINSLFASLRIAITYAMVTAIFAEFMGAKRGLGVFLNMASSSYQTDLVFLVVIFTAIVTLILIEINDYVHQKIIQ